MSAKDVKRIESETYTSAFKIDDISRDRPDVVGIALIFGLDREYSQRPDPSDRGVFFGGNSKAVTFFVNGQQDRTARKSDWRILIVRLQNCGGDMKTLRT